MYTDTYVCTCIHANIRDYIHLYSHMPVCMYVCMYVYMYICIYVYMYIYTRVYIYIYVYVYMCIYIYMACIRVSDFNCRCHVHFGSRARKFQISLSHSLREPGLGYTR